MKTAIYARVSRTTQSIENQIRELESFAESQNWQITDEFLDDGVSGDSSFRPAFQEMLKVAKEGRFDQVLVFQLSRFGRSMSEVIKTISDLNEINVSVHSFKENLSTSESSPYGKLLLAVLSALSEIELQLIRERVQAGVDRAKSNGVQFGRPRVGFDFPLAISLKQQGVGLRKIAEMTGASIATLSRRFNEVESVSKTLLIETGLQ